MPQKAKTVYVGMSGGVDSSVSAALLKRAGYNVVGVFIKVWEPEGFVCTWREDRRDAMRVAAHLGVPLLTLDLEKEYKRDVVDYMIAEYKAGRTPNPDVMCNRHIKFGAFYDWARARGADFVATGHYARVSPEKSLPAHGRRGKFATNGFSGFTLQCSADKNKDQTYFLWTLKPEQLEHVLFPIGHLTKPEVRKLAEKFKLPTATKKDSQGLCFVGQIDLKDFLSRHIDFEPGNVLNERGEKIGKHDGAILYTLGERHGFALDKQSPDEKAHYVIARDVKANTITVSSKPSLEKIIPKQVSLEKVNWLGELPKENKKYSARIRHRGEFLPCGVKIIKNGAEVEFFETPAAPAPGQSIVFYDKNICLGGGIIP